MLPQRWSAAALLLLAMAVPGPARAEDLVLATTAVEAVDIDQHLAGLYRANPLMQSFTPKSSLRVRAIRLYMGGYGGPGFHALLQLTDRLGPGTTDENVLAEGEIPLAMSTLRDAWLSVPIDVVLRPGKTYYVVLSMPQSSATSASWIMVPAGGSGRVTFGRAAGDTVDPDKPVPPPALTFEDTLRYQVYGTSVEKQALLGMQIIGSPPNTRTGTNVEVTLPMPGGRAASVRFASVTAPGDSTIAASDPSSPSRSYVSHAGSQEGAVASDYLTLATSATFAGPLTVCLPYQDPTDLDEVIAPIVLQPNTRTHQLDVLPTKSVDTSHNRICAQTSELWPFLIYFAGTREQELLTAFRFTRDPPVVPTLGTTTVPLGTVLTVRFGLSLGGNLVKSQGTFDQFLRWRGLAPHCPAIRVYDEQSDRLVDLSASFQEHPEGCFHFDRDGIYFKLRFDEGVFTTSDNYRVEIVLDAEGKIRLRPGNRFLHGWLSLQDPYFSESH